MVETAPLPVDPAAAQSANAQTTVALAIVAAMLVLALAAMFVAYFDQSQAGGAFNVVLVVVGSLATSLTAPSGIANVLAQAKKAAPGPQSDAGS